MIYPRRCDRLPPDRRRQMIDETSAFLTWALNTGVELPRIPSRRVDHGGFSQMLRMPGARAAVNHWWRQTLNTMAEMAERL